MTLTKPEKPAKKKTKQPPVRTDLTADKNGFVGGYFMPLGLNIGDDRTPQYYFLSNTMKSIVKFPASKLVRQNLLTLAPLELWMSAFQNSSGGVDNMAAADFLISISQVVGYFEETSIRGRGMWQDEGRFVFHAGNSLIINGNKTDLSISSDFVYELRGKVKTADTMLTSDRAKELSVILSSLNWEHKAAGRLLAGWLMIAPICGVLNWRPHVWLTGPRDSGKSWVLDKICFRILEGICGRAQGNTSEAGIRQSFKGDALPFLFDEAEGDTEKTSAQMQDILGLARSASTGDAPPPLKGSKDGSAVRYAVKSCFCLSSIVPQIKTDNDKRRFTILNISKLSDDSLFKSIAAERDKLLTREYCQAWQMRSIMLAKVILESVSVFISAIVELTNSRSLGEQIGTMLAGYYHIGSETVAERGDALAISSTILDYMGISKTPDTTDEEQCLQLILSKEEKVDGFDIEDRKTTYTMTVGELVDIAVNNHISLGITSKEANARLKRLGLKVDFIDDIAKKKDIYQGIDASNPHRMYLYILNASVWVKKALEGTMFYTSPSSVLGRMDGAIKSYPSRFAAGMQGRCVLIPVDKFL